MTNATAAIHENSFTPTKRSQSMPPPPLNGEPPKGTRGRGGAGGSEGGVVGGWNGALPASPTPSAGIAPVSCANTNASASSRDGVASRETAGTITAGIGGGPGMEGADGRWYG